MVLSFLPGPGPFIMGILNATPDSFSDGGLYTDTTAALAQAQRMIAEGADIIDVGGESTRPPGATYGAGAERISESEECARVLPVIKAIRTISATIPISIDTQHASVAREALAAGATIINDVSAGTTDPDILGVAAKAGVPLILMHGHGPLFDRHAIEEYHYEDVVTSVKTYLGGRITAARTAGVKEILADVGIGFGKGYQDNLKLLRHHKSFESLGVPMLLGVSRKSTIGRAMGGNVAPKDRIVGSVAAACYGALNGASVIRTHDVRETKEGLAVTTAIARA